MRDRRADGRGSEQSLGFTVAEPVFSQVEVPRAGSRDSRRVAPSDRMRRLVSAAPVTKQVVDRFIPGENVDEIVPIVRDLVTDRGLELTMDVVGEDIATPEQAEAAPRRLPGADRPAQAARPGHPRGDVREAVDVRPGAGRRPRAGAAERPSGRRGRRRHRHHGHPGRRGPHHPRLDVRHPRGTAEGLPPDRLRDPGVPVPYRGRRAPPRRRRQPRTVGEGRLRGARRGRLPAEARDRQGVRPHPEDADGGRRLPDDRVRTTRV
ncbi:hypothetical protein SFUMM280S_02465 [Streptomyces fumanus]